MRHIQSDGVKRGRIIDIEGTDGVGKMTQTRLLDFWLREKGLKSGILEFPDYTTVIGREIKSFLTEGRDYRAEVRHMLFAANRWEKSDQVVGLLRSCDIVLINRYTASNLAYGMSQGLSLDWLKHLELGLPKPDFVLVLDASPGVAMRRRPSMGDAYEADLALQHSVRRQYKKLAKRFGWVVVDAAGSIEEVHNSLRRIIARKMSSWGEKHWQP